MSTNFEGIPFDISAKAAFDWTITPIVVKEQIPYSNITVREVIGYEPARVTWTLLFATQDRFEAFAARINTSGTLMLPAGLQSLKGEQVTRENPGRVYDVLDQVTIESIGVPTYYRSGQVKVDATFERPVHPVTRRARVSL